MRFSRYLLSPFHDVNSKTSTHGQNIAALDGIRGIAVLIVVSSHTQSFNMKAQGGLGVILFFFLSGYILTLPFTENPRCFFKKKNALAYFSNRIFRLAPAYSLAAGITAVTMGFSIDWYLWNISFVKGWFHFWSVAQEARFYLLFPIIIILLSLSKSKYYQIVIALSICYFSYTFRGYHEIDMMNRKHIYFYLFMFSGGVTTCLINSMEWLKKVKKSNGVKTTLQSISLIILISFVLTSNEFIKDLWRPLFHSISETPYLGWKIPHIWLLLFMILFTTVTSYEKGVASDIVKNYFLRHIGLLSYSIYLIHMLIILQFKYIGLQNEGKFIFVFLVSYIYAFISYLIIEKPFIHLKKVIL
ncbi:acyltransferase family protein [Desulfogranum japonicum]|uniref:acyltransferase family protein n=1 Tax=Desulfogranum japonicum TaxID=231447 RepID=UPI00041AF6CB|nr:acyltransferase [Desulfogranum japonicum]